jgi:hypothetical protein
MFSPYIRIVGILKNFNNDGAMENSCNSQMM